MLLPIYAYGQPVLRKVAKPITAEYKGLKELIDNMWETMYHANGVGLAAPQIGKSIRLFVVDTTQMMEEGEEDQGIKEVFINVEKVDEAGEPRAYEEGCLSIPDIRGEVDRPEQVKIRYQNAEFEEQEVILTGLNARVVQHEYDHIDGVLFTEHLKPVKKQLIRRKLENIRKGKADVDYKMQFAVAKKR